MKLNAAGNLNFEVRVRTDYARGEPCPTLQLTIGPLHFTLTEGEALRLANRIADAIEQHRQHQERTHPR